MAVRFPYPIPRSMFRLMLVLAILLGSFRMYRGFAQAAELEDGSDAAVVKKAPVGTQTIRLEPRTIRLAVDHSANTAGNAPVSKSLLEEIGSTLLYSVIGIIFFVLTWYIVNIIMPFSVVKEIEEDQNTSLGIIIGAMMLGVAIIIAGVISS